MYKRPLSHFIPMCSFQGGINGSHEHYIPEGGAASLFGFIAVRPQRVPLLGSFGRK